MAEALPFPSSVQTAFFSSGSSLGLSLVLLLQVFREECGGEFPGFGGVVGAVARLVVGVLESVSGVGEDVNVRGLAQRPELRFELLDVGGLDALVLAAKDAEDSGINFPQGGIVGCEMAVVDHSGFQPGIGDREIQRVAAAHAPPDAAEALGFEVGLRA